MRNLLLRTWFGAAYLAVIISALIFSQYLFGAVFFVIAIFSLNELIELITPEIPVKSKRFIQTIYTLAIALIFLVFIQFIEIKYIGLLVITFPALIVQHLFFNSKRDKNTLLGNIFTILYLLLAFVALFIVAFLSADVYEFNGNVLLGFFILLWSNDTFAYIFGMWLGKHSLNKELSPKKSWEGFLGGAICTVGAAILINKFIGILSLTDWIVIATIVSVFGVAGDLFESFLKRQANVKDSGNLIPGHGGLLDRLDSFLFSIPIVAIYILVFN